MMTTVIFDRDDTLYDEIDFCRGGSTHCRVIGHSFGRGCLCDPLEVLHHG